MSKLFKLMLEAILSPEKIVKDTLIDKKTEVNQAEINTKNRFFVNQDGSIALNPNNEDVQKAFAANIEKFRSIRKG
ncbi:MULTISPECIES: hypothetical protein [Xenorhabdus]|uniref:hypothetical protein n=1 Tax=Xenorhabdus TaxID=626 RepID=UPI00064AFF4D|nr:MULTISPECIES: hypothetical protein [Xenorhabdus]KLU17448.1 hypothetical protein AAY47_00015 [Xenorhabdus griffiniae]KOP34698.1 hypothetical protein AFK69_03200 [Xenorhabdus sp. GDc328]